MKKLIALMFCLTVMTVTVCAQQQKKPAHLKKAAQTGSAVAQRAAAAAQQKAAQAERDEKVKQAQARMVTVSLTIDNNYRDKGQAVIVKFTDNYTHAVVIATESFTYDELLDEPQVRGQLVGGVVTSNKDGRIKDAQWLQKYSLSMFTVPCKLEGNQLEKAKKIAPLSVEQAVSLAKAVESAENEKAEKYRESIIILPPHK